MTHHEKPKNYPNSLQDLAEEIGDLRYDSLALFLDFLSEKMKKDAEKDLASNRVKLAKNLFATAEKLHEAKIEIDTAWEICEPYM